MATEDGRTEGERVHVLRTGCIDFATTRELRALCLGFGRCLKEHADRLRWKTKEEKGKKERVTYDNEGDTHKAEELPALFVVLTCYFDRAPGEAVHIFRGAYTRGLFAGYGWNRRGVNLPVSLASSPSSLASSLLSKRLESCAKLKGRNFAAQNVHSLRQP